ncbi:MAG: flagellar M-ring protein FliF, partial [Deltaproteobacteria bacterium]|nr:flagellar M-ring protein FliF [Deltaproteobacteria bacterium]
SVNDASSISDLLKTRGIAYSLKNGGRDIWVPANKIYQTRLDLAAKGMPTGGGVGFEIFDKQSFALTDFVQKVNHTRALQGELARTISSLEPVESTRVHLALPEKRLFKNQQKKATASVIIALKPGKKLETKQVKGIIHLVAGSVAGLATTDVNIIDSSGTVLDGDEKSEKDNGRSLDMLSYQQQVEHRLELRAQDLLDKTMGRDRAIVRVTASLDFSKVEKTEEFYNSDDPVIRSEQLSEESSGSQTTGGIPGVQSNFDNNFQGQRNTEPPSNSSSRTTNYEISKTVSKIINPIGSIINLSVSVVVADRVEKDNNGVPVATVPLSSEELKSVKNMVSTAIGLVQERGDMINVVSMPFTDTQATLPQLQQQDPQLFYQYLPLVKYGLILLGILFIYLLLIRPIIKTMRGDVQNHYKTVQQLEQEQNINVKEEKPVLPPVDDAISTLKKEVLQNHIPTSFIVKNWIQEG